MQTSAREGDEIGGGFSGKARTGKLWSSSPTNDLIRRITEAW
jgi:hypothetical protein